MNLFKESDNQHEIKNRELAMEMLRNFESWENNSLCLLSDYSRQLHDDVYKYAPKAPNDILSPHFIEAIKRVDFIDYLLDELFSADFKHRVLFFKNYRNEVKQIASRQNSNTI